MDGRTDRGVPRGPCGSKNQAIAHKPNETGTCLHMMYCISSGSSVALYQRWFLLYSLSLITQSHLKFASPLHRSAGGAEINLNFLGFQMRKEKEKRERWWGEKARVRRIWSGNLDRINWSKRGRRLLEMESRRKCFDFALYHHSIVFSHLYVPFQL